MSSEYKPESESGIRWDSVGIRWDSDKVIVSERDSNFIGFNEFNMTDSQKG